MNLSRSQRGAVELTLQLPMHSAHSLTKTLRAKFQPTIPTHPSSSFSRQPPHLSRFRTPTSTMNSPAFTASLPVRPAFQRTAISPISTRPSVYTTPRMAFSSIDRVLTADPTGVPGDIGTVTNAIYTQVLGNAYLMEEERDELRTAESQFGRDGDIRAFVRAIALSDAYKSRFFESVSQYRFIELAFKHLLGRAPGTKGDYQTAMAKYHNEGYEACVSWFVDSVEYDENFGNFVVPYGIYKGCYPTNEEFNRSVAMRLTPSSSDKARGSMLQYCVLSGDSPNWLSISKALPPGTEKGTGFTVGGHWTSTQRNKNAPVRVGTKIPGGVVFY